METKRLRVEFCSYNYKFEHRIFSEESSLVPNKRYIDRHKSVSRRDFVKVGLLS